MLDEIDRLIDSLEDKTLRNATTFDRILDWVQLQSSPTTGETSSEAERVTDKALYRLSQTGTFVDRSKEAAHAQVLLEARAQRNCPEAMRRVGLQLRQRAKSAQGRGNREQAVDLYRLAIEWSTRAGAAGAAKAWFEAGYAAIWADNNAASDEAAGASVLQIDDSVMTHTRLPQASIECFECGLRDGDGECGLYLYRHWISQAVYGDEDTRENAIETAQDLLESAAECSRTPSDSAIRMWAIVLRREARWDDAFSHSEVLLAYPRWTNWARLFQLNLLLDAPAGTLLDVDRESLSRQIRNALNGADVPARLMEWFQRLNERFAEINWQHLAGHRGLTQSQHQLIESLPEFIVVDRHDLPLRALFDTSRRKAALFQRELFRKMKGSLSRASGGPLDVVAGLNQIRSCAARLLEEGIVFARDVMNDGGLQWLLGEAYGQLGQIPEAVACFDLAAQLKDDPVHISICLRSKADAMARAGEFARAATTLLHALDTSKHPSLVLQMARMLLYAEQNRPLVALSLAYRFLEAGTRRTWRYAGVGADAGLEDFAGREIALPEDEDARSTVVQFALLVVEAKLLLAKRAHHPNVLDWFHKDMQFRAVNNLVALIRKAEQPEEFDPDLIKLLAQIDHPHGWDFIAALVAHTGRNFTGHRQRLKDFGLGNLHWRNTVGVLTAIAAGLSASMNRKMPHELLDSIVGRICNDPETLLRPDDRSLSAIGSALAALLMRGVLLDYFFHAKDPEQFQNWVQTSITARLGEQLPDWAYRLWLCELVISQGHSTEYAMASARTTVALRALDDLPVSVADARSWLSSPSGLRAAQEIDRLVSEVTGASAPGPYARFDTDTPRFAVEELRRVLGDRLRTVWAGSSMNVRALVDIPPGTAWRPLLSLQRASIVDTAYRLLLSRSQTCVLFELADYARSIDVTLMVDAEHLHIRAVFASHVADTDHVSQKMPICYRRVQAERRLHSDGWATYMTFNNERGVWRINADVQIEWANQDAIDPGWLQFLNAVKNEHLRYRREQTPDPDFFDLALRAVPYAPRDPSRAATLINAVCDRFFGLYALRWVSDDTSRNPAGLIHHLRDDLEKLRHSAGPDHSPDAEIRVLLARFRRSLLLLQKTSLLMLGQGIRDWQRSITNLGEFVVGILASMNIQVDVTCGSEGVFALVAQLPLRLVIEGVVADSLKHGRPKSLAVSVTLDIRSATIRVENEIMDDDERRSSGHARGTGVGWRHVQDLASNAGLRVEADHEQGRHVVRIHIPREIPAAGNRDMRLLSAA